jgi:uncharacterized protein YyaL (SSP411 family)
MANRLISEQSQYLLQHAHNPVDWYPWGDEAFVFAREQNKPVIVSIGYSACHWCHVMERESFENADTAAYMNEHFVCIKVDREEHPDVDHMYMDAVQAISGSGGWPLNVFVTPDRIPFYGGTYYPPRPAYNRPSWMQLLQRMVTVWHQQQDEVQLQAGQMLQHLQQAARVITAKGSTDWNKNLPDEIAANLLDHADKIKGGFGNAPKFPGTMAITYLLEHYHFTGNKDSLHQALLSLDAMADGGIYDQLGGGFARYSTDREWLAPHFEKMLYDNALLIIAYSDAYAVTKNERYRKIVEETIAFAERELKDSTGIYYCALDADSEGVEGRFYTWTWDEWLADLGDSNTPVAAYFGITEDGNWERTNILHLGRNAAEIAAQHGITEMELMHKVDVVKARLLEARSARIRPLTDDKSLLSWNALMNLALVKAAVSFTDDTLLQRATDHAAKLLSEFDTAAGLMHAWKGGVAKIPAKLDDIAYLAQALLQLASATGNMHWAARAIDLTEKALKDFAHADGFFYFTSAKQTDIPVRKLDLYDGATPSANAVMAHNLWLCGMLAERNEWIAMADKMLYDMAGTTRRYAYSFGYWAQLIQRSIYGQKTVVVAGADARDAVLKFYQSYLPQAFPLFITSENKYLPILENKFSDDKMHIFVCSGDRCLPPVTNVAQAIRLINDFE